MFKRITILLILIIFSGILAVSFAPSAFAGNGDDKKKENLTPIEESFKKKADEFLPPKAGSPEGTTPSLPAGHFKKTIIPQAINILLAVTATISFGVFVYAGIMLLIGQGNEEDVTKFKNTLIWSLVGLAFITIAYAFVRGIMQLVFE